MSRAALLLAENPRSADWELPASGTAGGYLLLGWRTAPEPVDGGVPDVVAAALAGALCGAAVVSFLSGDPHAMKRTFALVSTADPKVAVRLFDDAGYLWTQHGQLALLSARDSPVPRIAHAQLRDLLEQQDIASAARAGFRGVMLPGVDGDVAGLWLFHPEDAYSFRAVLRESCTAAPCELQILSEDGFREALRRQE